MLNDLVDRLRGALSMLYREAIKFGVVAPSPSSSTWG